MKKYVVVYLAETDGDVVLERMTEEQIKELAKRLDYTDFAVIDGTVVKSFNNKWSK